MKQKCLLALFGGRLPATLTSLGIAVMAGCGGNVVVDDPGSGGGGSGGGGATTTTNWTGGTTGGTTITTGATTTTTVNPPTYCQILCKQADDLGCLMGSSQAECQDGCVQVFQEYAACEAELKSFYDCVLDELQSGCDIGNACDPQSNKLNDCINGMDPCEEYGCVGGSDGYCACDGTCNGDYMMTECKYSADGYLTCNCLENGELIGTCDQPQNSCSIFESCCTSFFFQKK